MTLVIRGIYYIFSTVVLWSAMVGYTSELLDTMETTVVVMTLVFTSIMTAFILAYLVYREEVMKNFVSDNDSSLNINLPTKTFMILTTILPVSSLIATGSPVIGVSYLLVMAIVSSVYEDIGNILSGEKSL